MRRARLRRARSAARHRARGARSAGADLSPNAFELGSCGALLGVAVAAQRRAGARRLGARALRPELSRALEAGVAAAFALAALSALWGAFAPDAAARLGAALALGAVAALALSIGWRGAPRVGLRPGGTPELAGALALVAAALALLALARAPAAAANALAALGGVQFLRFAGERQHARSGRTLAGGADAFRAKEVLKTDLFGRIELGVAEVGAVSAEAVRRDFRAGALWLRPVAAFLARREARALGWLDGVPGVARLLDRSRGRFLRSWIEGRPIARAFPADPGYYTEARRLLRRIHAAGVTHNDTHKAYNWLVTPEGRPALLDFQIASRHAARTRWFRLLALEDVRHLLKHKRSALPERLTRRERALLERRSWIARGWLATVKPVYVLVTRRLLRWRDNEGRG